VKNKLITPYTPTANGRVERQHREIGRFLDTFQAKIVDGHSLELVLSITQIHLNQRSDAHVLTFGQEPTTVERLLVTTLNNDPEEIDIDKLINIMSENTQWKLLQSDEQNRNSSLQQQISTGTSRKHDHDLHEGDQIIYNNEQWIVLRVYQGLQGITSIEVKSVKNPNLVQKVPPSKVVVSREGQAILPQLSTPTEATSNDIIFYKSQQQNSDKILCGKPIENLPLGVLIHCYIGNHVGRYKPSYWTQSENNQWVIKPLPKAPVNAQKVYHVVTPDQIIATGQLSRTGKPTRQLMHILNQQGVR
jgi:hypothetical protein